MKDTKLSVFLKKSREAAGLTQIEVAKFLGYGSSQFVSNWERGLSTPPMASLARLSKLYRVDMDRLYKHIFEVSIAMTKESLEKQYRAIKKKKST